MALAASIRNTAAAPVSQFSQTAFVFGVVMFTFLVYVTIKGDLPKWLGLLGLGGSPTSSGLIQPGTNGQTASQAYATPGTNSAGAALPDAISGNYGSNVIPFPTLPQLGTVVQ